jgi:KipI family sensor histidine kinase inhibitor
MRLLPFGVDGILVELDDLATVLAALGELEVAPLPGVLELVPGARTILVRYEPGLLSMPELASALSTPAGPLAHRTTTPPISIPVVYDGEDLAEVAAFAGIGVNELVRRHSAPTYVVAFTGFAPGFAYLAGGDPLLVVPRRSFPRTSIPAGAVGVAGEFSGVYPRRSPGGWQLIGSTDLAMWDGARGEHPALLEPGNRVRFVPERATARVAGAGPAATEPSAAASSRALRIESVGLLATVQDLGRPGHRSQGVSRSGAMDRPSLRRANRLVGNPAATPAIEFTAALEVKAGSPLVLGAAGSVGTMVRVDLDGERERLSPGMPHTLRTGERLELGTGASGVYGYLAVFGGIEVQRTLGSSSTDLLSGLGPAPIRSGDVVAVGHAHEAAVTVSPEPAPAPAPDETIELEVVVGPRDDWFEPASVDRFFTRAWTVSSQSNRIGIRLTGAEPLDRVRTDELPSEGMQPGAVQVPPDGEPVVFAADHPVTGGYPVLATLTPAALTALAQRPPGSRVTFRRA